MPTTTRLLRLAPLAASLGLALAWLVPACFSPPNDDVLFACDPVDDPRCPEGYTCESDGCCHKNGTDVAASLGACGLGGNEGGTATETDAGTDTTGTDTTGTDTTDTETDTTGTDTTEGTDTGTSDTTSG